MTQSVEEWTERDNIDIQPTDRNNRIKVKRLRGCWVLGVNRNQLAGPDDSEEVDGERRAQSEATATEPSNRALAEAERRGKGGFVPLFLYCSSCYYILLLIAPAASQ